MIYGITVGKRLQAKHRTTFDGQKQTLDARLQEVIVHGCFCTLSILSVPLIPRKSLMKDWLHSKPQDLITSACSGGVLQTEQAYHMDLEIQLARYILG